MSRENVEMLRRSYEAYRAADYETAIAVYSDDCEGPFRPNGRVFRGPRDIADAMRTWRDTWEDWRFEVEEVIDAGDQVVVRFHESGRGKGSGVEIDQTVFHVLTVRDGEVVHWSAHFDRDEALEAAGLRE
jgi:ketosteroid isomerase-like protein